MKKNKKFIGLLFIGIVALFFTCSSPNSSGSEITEGSNEATENPFFEIKGKAQGTTYYIKYYGKEITSAADSILGILNEVDRCFSLWRDDAELVRLNSSKAKSIDLEDPKNYFKELFAMSKNVYRSTEGSFNPALHPLISAWGFSRKKGITLDSIRIDSMLALTEFDNWKLIVPDEGNSGTATFEKPQFGSLDFNAIAQGYTVDLLGDFLRGNEVKNFFVEVGGETLTSGKKSGDNKWVVALDKPVEMKEKRILYDTIYISDKALVTSGNYRKFIEIDGKKYSHTINPDNGYPSENQLLSVSVIMDNCAMADAYATAMMVMGKEKSIVFAEEKSSIEGIYLIYEEDGEMKDFISEGFLPYLNP